MTETDKNVMPRKWYRLELVLMVVVVMLLAVTAMAAALCRSWAAAPAPDLAGKKLSESSQRCVYKLDKYNYCRTRGK